MPKGPTTEETRAAHEAPAFVRTMTDAMACETTRDLIYFYRSGTDFADRADIEAFTRKHSCAILPKGKRYAFAGAGQFVSTIVVGSERMYVRADMIVGQ